MQSVEADMHQAKLESEGRLAALRKELLAAEDRERAELEQEYRQADEDKRLYCTDSRPSGRCYQIM